MRILVTGGAGFLGSMLCRRLLSEGNEVVVVDNLCTGEMENLADVVGSPRLTFLEHDITQPLEAPSALDRVYHMASPASPPDYLRMPLETLWVNSVGTRNALDIARDSGARFLLTSTSEVYGDPEVHPQPETYWGCVNPIGPRSVYDESKRFAESLTVTYAQVHGVQVRIARIFNTYGPGMRHIDGRAIPEFITRAFAGLPLQVHGDGAQTRSFCYVDDTVGGLIRLMESDFRGPVNIGGNGEMSILDLAKKIVEITGSSSTIEFVPRPIDDPQVRNPDLTVAEIELGWRPTTGFDEGIRKMIEWLQTQGMTRT